MDVTVVEPVAGSMRVTLCFSRLSDQTAPSPTANAHGGADRATTCVTSLDAGIDPGDASCAARAPGVLAAAAREQDGGHGCGRGDERPGADQELPAPRSGVAAAGAAWGSSPEERPNASRALATSSRQLP